MIKYIKNADSVDHIWLGQLIHPNEYYQILPEEEIEWANDSKLLTDIANGIAIVAKASDGSADITDVNEAINYLKDNLPKEVQTQFEKNDKILKLICTKGQTDATGLVTISIKVPGIYANGDGRYVEKGIAFFGTKREGDKVVKVQVVDKDNVLGYGANFVVKTWHDEEAPSSDQGWYINSQVGYSEVDSFGGYGFIPAQLYLEVQAQSAAQVAGENFYLNLKWGKVEQ